jgi:group I intron endonuclease
MIIYKVTNKINNKIYIGKTIRSLVIRRKEHEKSNNKMRMIFHKALKKYGIENFDLEIIDTAIAHQELCERERYWIKKLNSRDTNIGYNITEGGEIGDTLSNNPNKSEIIRKMSETMLELYKKHPERKLELSKKLSGKNNPMYGKSYHTHGLINYAKFRKNKKFDDIFSIEKVNAIKSKISIGNKNKKITLEQKEHYRLANLGEKNPFYRKLPQKIIDSILEEYSTTKVFKEISNKLNISSYLVKRTLKQNNVLKNRSYSEIVSGKNNPRFINVSDNLKNIVQDLFNYDLNFSARSIRNVLLSYNIDLSRHKICTILKEKNIYKQRKYTIGNVIVKSNKEVKLETILDSEVLKKIKIEALNATKFSKINQQET